MNKVAKVRSAVLAGILLALSISGVAIRASDAWSSVSGKDWNLRFITRHLGVDLSFLNVREPRLALAIAQTFRTIALRYQAEVAVRLDPRDPVSLRGLIDIDLDRKTDPQPFGDGLGLTMTRGRAHPFANCSVPRPTRRGVHLRYNC